MNLGNARLLPVIVMALTAATASDKEATQVTYQSDMATIDGPSDSFTGHVTITGRFRRPSPSRVSGSIVHFARGARTAWHKHPLGQTLIVTRGAGWVQARGEPVVEIRAGDIVWCPPNREHWHGATAHTDMTHITITEALDGVAVSWLGHVSEEEYAAGQAGRAR